MTAHATATAPREATEDDLREAEELRALASSLSAYAAEIHKRGHQAGCGISPDSGCSCDWMPACRILLAFPAPVPGRETAR